MAHVFISYKREDKAFALELRQRLDDANLNPWMDENIPPSRKWRDEIDESLRDAFALVLIITPAAMKSEYVTYEWIFALGANKDVVPVYLKPVKTFPYRLGDIQFVDFCERYSWDKLVQRLREIKSNQDGNRVPVPKSASPKVRAGLEKLNSFIHREAIEGAELLGNLKDPIAVPGLVTTLSHDDNEIMNAAFQALIKIGDPAVLQLVKALLTQEGNVLWTVANALSQIKSEAAFLGLLDALKDVRNDVQKAALYFLGSFKDVRALPAVLPFLHDKDSIMRGIAVQALTQIGDKTAVPALIEALQDTDRDVRSIAAGGLGVVKDVTAVPELLNMLHDSEFQVRIAVAHSLGEIGDPTAIDGLLGRVKDQNDGVRMAALNALNKIHTPEATEAINQWPTRNDR